MGDKEMNQYCRYCTQAVAQADDYAWCGYRKTMVGKDARRKNCKGYEFCKIDAFYAMRGLEATDPKAWYTSKEKKREPDLHQVELIEWIGEK